MMSQLKEANFQITGMTCAACATKIEKALNKIDGVEEANVNLALEKAKITFDPAQTESEQFKKKG